MPVDKNNKRKAITLPSNLWHELEDHIDKLNKNNLQFKQTKSGYIEALLKKDLHEKKRKE